MNSVRKVVGFLTVLALAAFVLPASAAVATSKTFSYTVAGGPVLGTSFPLTVTVTNADPIDGNSNWNSFKLTAPSQLLITGADLPVCSGVQTTAPGTFFSPTYTPTGVSTIGVQGIPPVKPQKSCVMTIYVKINPALATSSCGTSDSGTWSATVYTGSNLSGQTFSNVGTPLNPKTGYTIGCLSLNQPKDAVTKAVITDTAFTPTVIPPTVNPIAVTLNPVPAAGTAVTLSNDCGLSFGTTSSATTNASGVATFGSLASSTAGSSCKLTASAAGYNSATNGSTFRVYAPSLSFLNQPKNALTGVVVTDTPFNTPQGNYVQVQLLLDNSATLPTGFPATTVSMTSTCTGLSGSPEDTNTSGKATFDSLEFTNAGQNCTLTASALGASSSPSSTFNAVAFTADGVLNCAQAFPSVYVLPTTNPGSNDPGYVSGNRGPWNAKADLCVPVSYDFTNKVLIDDTTILKWDTVSQPSAAFFYTVNSNVRLLNLTTLTPDFVVPKVAWEFDGAGLPIAAKTLDALACVERVLPIPYGQIPAGGLAAGATSVTLDTSTVPTGGYKALPAVGASFPMYVDSERMKATVGAGGSLTLARAVEAGSTAAAHAAGTYAISTPLPIDPRSTSPYYLKAVHMCMGAYGFQMYTPDPGTGNPRYFQFTDMYDVGDGYTKMP